MKPTGPVFDRAWRCDYADKRTGKRYSRRSHVPADADIVRVPRVSKHRFTYQLRSKA